MTGDKDFLYSMVMDDSEGDVQEEKGFSLPIVVILVVVVVIVISALIIFFKH